MSESDIFSATPEVLAPRLIESIVMGCSGSIGPSDLDTPPTPSEEEISHSQKSSPTQHLPPGLHQSWHGHSLYHNSCRTGSAPGETRHFLGIQLGRSSWGRSGKLIEWWSSSSLYCLLWYGYAHAHVRIFFQDASINESWPHANWTWMDKGCS